MLDTFSFADHIVGVIIDSHLDKDTTESLQQKLLEKLKKHQRVNLFVEVQKESEISADAFIKNMQFNFKHIGEFHKIAIVSDINWLKGAMSLKDIVVEANIETFPHKDRLKALNWISE
ncbi:STAS/SEC14 domain-containing protein [Autumnicola musiva]|uniref:STAS/SEC14 domain-containing protein n=1 Tax=Autumnicola musiva TaxID=3075589 RepID=A0ABU3D1U6_9FLAO|nr:STAS/SEC14 domain-containing protein [Zunongwangia sp. F117]MDT0675482.1 STAS/SEC14 domain-containing protein [Zunongwangia sp. F117]